MPERFELVGKLENVQIIARGRGVRERWRLNAEFGRGQWRKMKGIATVRLETGEVFVAEVHWYEAHGIGKRDFKIKAPIR